MREYLTRRSLLKTTLFILALVLAIMVVASIFIARPHESAQASGYTWSPSVRYKDGDRFITLTDRSALTGDVLGASGELYYFIEPTDDNELDGNNSFHYVKSSTYLSQDQLYALPINSWTLLDKSTATPTEDGKGFYVTESGFNGASDNYFYFRRTYTVNEGGVTTSYYEYSPYRPYVRINTAISESDIGVYSVKAQFLRGNSYVDYTGNWLSGALRITVTTVYMNSYSVSYSGSIEHISYSIDGGKNYIPASNNVIEIKDVPLTNQDIRIMVEDVGRTIKSEPYVYGAHTGESKVNMDPTTPNFSVSATTLSVSGETVDYTSNTWSSEAVRFILTNESACNSKITYYYSTEGSEYIPMDSKELTIQNSRSSIRFRAENESGLVYNFGTNYVVKIDGKQPNVNLSATTPEPDAGDENIVKNLDITKGENGILQAGYANGKIIVYVYNRDLSGNVINNESGTVFYYQSRTASGQYSNSWTRMTSLMSGSSETCYTISDSTSKDISITKYYKFKIVSNAGLESSEVELTFTLLKASYVIDIEKIDAAINSSGWIADKAVVSMIVPTDSKLSEGSYTIPTTNYTFYYVPSDGTGEEFGVSGRAIKFHEELDGVIYWIYEFDLVASAHSTFYIYTRNAAGKKSANTVETTEKIAIDVLEPVYEMTAYVLPIDQTIDKDDYVYLDVNDPGWVNGSIVLTVKVKVGVSGVYIKDMVYAKDSNGNILTDVVTGQIVWQEKGTARVPDEIIVENEIEYYYYYVTINLDDNTMRVMSRDTKFRIYTGSGIYKEISFTANIDTTDTVRLSEIDIVSGEKQIDVTISDANGVINMNEYDFLVCEDVNLTFASSLDSEEFEDHYRVYYSIFDGAGIGDLLEYAANIYNYQLVGDNGIDVDIENGKKGTVYIALYLENEARDYKGERKKSGYYVVSISYDTVNLIIGYDIGAFMVEGENITDVSEAMEGGSWVSGYLEITLSIYINTEGDVKADESYTFYYMQIDGNVLNIKDAVAKGTWIEASNGYYTVDGQYVFNINFVEDSFYGRLAFSVRNGAGYRNVQDASSAKIIRIDNTTPDVDEAIIYKQHAAGNREGVRGESSKISVGGTESQVNVLTYFSTQEITLQGVVDSNRSNINYYYMYLPTVDKVEYQLSELTQLSQAIGLFESIEGAAKLGENEYRVVYYAIYAVNSVGAEADGAQITDSANNIVTFDTIYCFVYDSNSLDGDMKADESKGYYSEQLKMWSYEWVDSVTINLTARGTNVTAQENYLSYEFSVDGGNNWFVYLDAGIQYWYAANDTVGLYFNADVLKEYVDKDGNRPFLTGVMSAFLFRAINKSGTIMVMDSVYIAIDETLPEFEIKAVDHLGISYTGGSTESLSSGDEVWKSGPITVTIDISTMPTGGVITTYYLAYIENGNTVYTREDGSVGKVLNTLTFTTDMLDGFNKNRDAILYVTVTSRANANLFMEKAIRLSVDQVVPEFSLLGHASNDESDATQTIVSGQWTNRNTVSISKAEKQEGQNVSEVVYTYTYKDSTSTGVTEFTWANEEGNITRSNSCEIVVTATTESGLTYTQPFIINIDTVAPKIKFDGNINVIEDQEYYIDLKVFVEEANIEICEYITIKGDTRGFAFDPTGYILSTSSVDNSIRYDNLGNEYRGYVKVYVKDYAGNEDTFVLYILPFKLTVNNITLSDEDLAQVDEYAAMLAKARTYMESSRVAYFENLISRLNDRINTLYKEITGYQDYLEKLANRTSFELRSDYAEMFDYLETFNDYEIYGQGWIQDAITGDSTSKYYAYYQNFLTQFGKLKALMDKVEKVETNVIALPAINMVEREDYEDILRTYDEYKDLTMDQKACFTANLYNKLMELKESCEVLLLTDGESGVAIDGDFAPGATISVTEYDSTTDTFANAQSLLANTVSENQPRTIVSIRRIALDGAYSQTVASDMVVTLPIPEEYRNYIYFAVYELSDDGSLKAVEDTEIQPDGESVVFSTAKLATYVLCIKAEMEATDTSENTYGTIMGIQLDVKMIKYLIYAGIALFGVVILIVIILGIRHRRFLNSYNKAYRHSLYRKGVKGIPKGNKKY